MAINYFRNTYRQVLCIYIYISFYTETLEFGRGKNETRIYCGTYASGLEIKSSPWERCIRACQLPFFQSSCSTWLDPKTEPIFSAPTPLRFTLPPTVIPPPNFSVLFMFFFYFKKFMPGPTMEFNTKDTW